VRKEVDEMKKENYKELRMETLFFEGEDVITNSVFNARSVVDSEEAQDVADEVML